MIIGTWGFTVARVRTAADAWKVEELILKEFGLYRGSQLGGKAIQIVKLHKKMLKRFTPRARKREH